MRTPRLLLALALTACSSVPVAPAEPEPATSCTDVCARGAELGCEFAQATPGGASCVDVCENVQRSGIIEWDLACRASAPSCETLDRCEER